jgi:predicted nucleic acid-binding protein
VALTWLIDTSALVRIGDSIDAEVWADRMSRGLVRIAPVTRLEIGYSSRSGATARRAFSSAPLNLLPVEYSTPSIEDRALEVQFLLADQGHHRAPSIPDLLIAAIAELAGLSVLHVDKDFELIAGITGQPTERLRR